MMTNAEAIETLRANYPDACYEQLREAVDKAIKALKAQDATGDTISRKAAIDALDKEYRCTDKSDDWDGLKTAMLIIENLPIAQPEERTEERTETHACDCISRQAAIDAHYEYCNKHPDAGFPVWSLKILEDLPSAQPNVHPDGTLIINVPDLDNVHRVLVSSGKRCKLFYLDE